MLLRYVILSLTLLSQQIAHGQDFNFDRSRYETVEFDFDDSNPLVLNGEELKLLDVSDVGAIHQIAGIFIRGEAELRDAWVEVTINHRPVGSFHFPVRDPAYWSRNFNPMASNKIGLRIKSGRRVKLAQVVIVRSVERYHEDEISPSAPLPVANEMNMDRCLGTHSRRHCMYKVLDRLFYNIDELDGIIDRDQFGQYFPAVLAAATDVKAAIQGNQIDSATTVAKISNLLTQLHVAEEFLLELAGGRRKLRQHALAIISSYYAAHTLKLRIMIAIG